MHQMPLETEAHAWDNYRRNSKQCKADGVFGRDELSCLCSLNPVSESSVAKRSPKTGRAEILHRIP